MPNLLRTFLVFTIVLLMTNVQAQPQRFFIGTYTNTGGKGIYTATFDPATGAIDSLAVAAEVGSPSFIAFSPDRRALYAVSEPTKAVHAYALDAASGTLRHLNELPAAGGGPCDVAVDATGRTVVIANYGGGSVTAFAVGDDGHLRAQSAFHQHTHFTATHPRRQEKPHAHGVTFTPDNTAVLVPDLGGDRVYVYSHDAHTSALTPHAAQPWLELTPGSGPRHATFSPDGRHLYVITELANTVAVFARDTATGAFAPVQTIGTLPDDFTGQSTTAEIAVSADGRHVYGSNRGHDSIAGYTRDADHGTLTLRQIAPSGGKNPRHFTLSPDGRWLLAAHQDTDTIVVHRVDPATGELTPASSPPLSVPRPVCVRFP